MGGITRFDLVELGAGLGQIRVDPEILDIATDYHLWQMSNYVPPCGCLGMVTADKDPCGRWQWLGSQDFAIKFCRTGSNIGAIVVVDEAGLVDGRLGWVYRRVGGRAGSRSRLGGNLARSLNRAACRCSASLHGRAWLLSSTAFLDWYGGQKVAKPCAVAAHNGLVSLLRVFVA